MKEREIIQNKHIIWIFIFLFVGISVFFYTTEINPFFSIPFILVGLYFLSYSQPSIKLQEFLYHFFILILGLIFLYLVYSFILPRFNLRITFLPVMCFGMFACLLFERLDFSLSINLLLSLFVGIMAKDLDIFFILLVSSTAGVLLVYKARTRTEIIKAAIMASILQLLLDILIVSLHSLNLPILKSFLYSDLGNGLLSFVLVSSLLPVFEYLFGVVTNIRLLELSDFNHPLLRRMILEAPGTYQHSIVVANLSELAAEAIGANSLLARVGAYFHDVGKILRPEYFIENQLQTKNRHLSLNPSMSKLVITNHVKEGIELAKKYRLPPPIIDFIPQHHGTSLVSYFYHQATKNASKEEKQKLKEEFRYTGPKPQSKETAIVLLADSVEAASRVLEDPSPSRIEDLVEEIFKEKIEDGQLDDTDLTLKELAKIKEVFIRVLNAIYHARIEYPQKNAESNSTQSSKNKENKNK